MSGLSRRQFVVGAGASSAVLLAGCGRLPWQAQATRTGIARVGVLSAGTPPSNPSLTFDQLVDGLHDLGYLEGQGLTLEWRFAEGQPERLPALARELATMPVDVVVAVATPEIAAAREATAGIPIIMVAAGDPVGAGFVTSLARPGGNITGLSIMSRELIGKRLEILREVVPGLSRVGVLREPANPLDALNSRGREEAARVLGVTLEYLAIESVETIERTLDSALDAQVDALEVGPSVLLLSRREQVTAFAARNGLPTIYAAKEFVLVGGLMSYGASLTHQWRRAAYYVDRILKGAKPADLPVEQPMIFDFVVNMKTAQALGITFPNEIMLQVTDVIQ
jgi:putative ABC transport system substrate-binding protein